MNNQSRGELVPGGLAMIIRGKQVPQNLGKVVELLFSVIGPERVSINNGENWVEVPSGVRAWVVVGHRLIGLKSNSGREIATRQLVCKAKHLSPINPEPDPISIDQRQECEA